MLTKIKLSDILFIDIETVPEYPSFEETPAEIKTLWADKTRYKRKEGETPADFYAHAGIWAEFGKIVCLGLGYFTQTQSERQFKLTAFTGNEEQILIDFKAFLEENHSHNTNLLCAHNGKEFDFPYLARRYIIKQVPLPQKLDLAGKKPWEVPHLDTLELWKFGDYKHYTSLKLLTSILGVPSPKTGIDGSNINELFYKKNDLDTIKTYCCGDVLAVAQVFLRFKQKPLLEVSEVLNV